MSPALPGPRPAVFLDASHFLPARSEGQSAHPRSSPLPPPRSGPPSPRPRTPGAPPAWPPGPRTPGAPPARPPCSPALFRSSRHFGHVPGPPIMPRWRKVASGHADLSLSLPLQHPLSPTSADHPQDCPPGPRASSPIPALPGQCVPRSRSRVVPKEHWGSCCARPCPFRERPHPSGRQSSALTTQCGLRFVPCCPPACPAVAVVACRSPAAAE